MAQGMTMSGKLIHIEKVISTDQKGFKKKAPGSYGNQGPGFSTVEKDFIISGS
jgi:hypothetical protein